LFVINEKYNELKKRKEGGRHSPKDFEMTKRKVMG